MKLMKDAIAPTRAPADTRKSFQRLLAVEPIKHVGHYSFLVVIDDGSGGSVTSMKIDAERLLDQQMFRSAVLEHTGRCFEPRVFLGAHGWRERIADLVEKAGEH